MIYFVQGVDGGLIKIGHTTGHMSVRLLALQHGSPVPLVCLAVADGTLDDEFELHAHFTHARAYSEWFHPVPELLALIAEARRTPNEWHDYRLQYRPRKHSPGHPGAAMEWIRRLTKAEPAFVMEAP